MKFVSLVLATALAAVIGTSPSLAQPTGMSSGNTPPGPQMNAPTHPGPGQWARDRDWNRPGWQGGGYGYGWMAPHAGWMMGHHWPGRRGHHGGWQRGPRGARFTFTRGNARVDIQCPANQSLKECIDAASTLMDKVRGMGRPTSGQPKPTP